MRLLVSVITAFMLVAVAAEGLARYARRHYVPQQQMDRALAQGDGCILFLGDSRMVAALDAEALHRELRSSHSDRCHVELAIGATQIGGTYLTAREYLRHGRRPRLAVIGKVGDAFLGPIDPLRPEEMVGNNAINLTWSTPADVVAEVPGFPAASVDAFDRGFRFLVARASALGQYQSLASAKVQRLQARLVGDDPVPRNRFGAVADMASLESDLRERASDRFAVTMSIPPSARYGAWFQRLADLFRAEQIPMLVVELPMRALYRSRVTDTHEARAYEAWLAEELASRGDFFLDLSQAEWVDDKLFVDDLHLGSTGAALVSTEIGRKLGTIQIAHMRAQP